MRQKAGKKNDINTGDLINGAQGWIRTTDKLIILHLFAISKKPAIQTGPVRWG
ncbi:MAG: hypothetical protein K9G33_15910 [Sneathiella sp.]|nr:hypothetical protein [Sneathiella sp.]